MKRYVTRPGRLLSIEGKTVRDAESYAEEPIGTELPDTPAVRERYRFGDLLDPPATPRRRPGRTERSES